MGVMLSKNAKSRNKEKKRLIVLGVLIIFCWCKNTVYLNIAMRILVNIFDDAGNSLATPYAGSNNTIFLIKPFHIIGQLYG